VRTTSEVFAPLIGQLIWQVRLGFGTFMTAEFGQPHLRVREPMPARRTTTDVDRRILARRRVFVTGDWHLWIQNGEWSVATAHYTANASDNAPSAQCLGELEGQRLQSADKGGADKLLVLGFDLGGTLIVSPSLETPEDQWSLHRWDGGITSSDSSGQLTFDGTAQVGAQPQYE